MDCGVGRCEAEERRCGVECEEWRAAWSECMMVDRRRVVPRGGGGARALSDSGDAAGGQHAPYNRIDRVVWMDVPHRAIELDRQRRSGIA